MLVVPVFLNCKMFSVKILVKTFHLPKKKPFPADYQLVNTLCHFSKCVLNVSLCSSCAKNLTRGGEIAKWLASLCVKWAFQVRAQLGPFVSERWNSISMLLTCPH